MFGGTGEGRKYFGLILGLIFLALGVIPLLNQFGIIAFSLPTIPQMVLWILGVIGGILLLIDAMKEGQFRQGLMIVSLILALALLVISVIPLLGTFGVISFALPAIGKTIIDVLFAVAGIMLIIGAFAAQM